MSTRIPVAILVLACLSAEVALAQQQQESTGGFGGPSILSIPGMPLGRALGRPIGFRVYASIRAQYSTSLGGPLDSNGNITSSGYDNTGGRASWGVYGVQQGPRDFLGIDYSGNYTYYTSGRKGDGQILSLTYGRQLTQRTTFFVGATGGRYTFLQTTWRNALFPSDPTGITDPAANPFDTTTLGGGASAGVRHMFTETWAVSLSGGGFYAGRKDPRLIDSEGTHASASVSRRLGPNQELGGSYHFQYFFFPNGFGDSFVHTATVDYHRRLSETWNLNLSAGGSRVDNERLQSVPLDPLLAQLTGQSSLLQAANILVYRPAVAVTLGKQFEQSSLSFYYRKQVSPGTAFITTTHAESGGVSYSYTGTERWNVGFNGSADKRSALFQEVGSYQSYGGGVGVGYRIWQWLHFTANVQARRYQVRGSDFQRTRANVSVGLSFSPGDTPLALF